MYIVGNTLMPQSGCGCGLLSRGVVEDSGGGGPWSGDVDPSSGEEGSVDGAVVGEDEAGRSSGDTLYKCKDKFDIQMGAQILKEKV